MKKIKIVFLDRNTFPDSVILKRLPNTELISFATTNENQVVERASDADIIITNKVKITQESLAQLPLLKFIAVAATGTDIVDIAACHKKGIPVANIRNYAINTVPEHTFALILALRRNIVAYHQAVRHGRWQEANQFCFFDYPIKNLAGSSLGIIGDGVLGKAVAEIAKAFGMTVYFSAYKGLTNMGPLYTPFDEVLQRSDIISIHCPLFNSTRNMIDEAEFKKMKPECLLINTARGGIVNETALYHALVDKQIAGAAFDVTVNEPPHAEDAIMKLTSQPNFILTPHISWASIEAIQLLADILIDNIEHYLAGQPKNIVTA